MGKQILSGSKYKLLYLLSIVMFFYSCHSFQSIVETDKKIKTLPNFTQAFELLEKDKLYKVKTDSTTLVFIFSNQYKKQIIGHKRGDIDNVITIDKSKIVSIKEKKFSRSRTDLFTISTYGLIGSMIYLLLSDK